jgi:ABC-type bacteriocin/lantibiotic exporter with double-glycine peptidase domain
MNARAVAAAVVAACAQGAAACHNGTAPAASPTALAGEPGWTLVRGVPFVPQAREESCGAAALAMVLSFWAVPPDDVRAAGVDPAAGDAERGIGAGQLRDWARASGLDAYLVSADLGDLASELGRGHPIVVGLERSDGPGRVRPHYEVVVGIHREKQRILTLDPAAGWRENSLEAFAREWLPGGRAALMIFPATARARL